MDWQDYNRTKKGEFSDLIGKTITEIKGAKAGSDEIMFFTSDGQRYLMSHSQDCCEYVSVEDVIGDLETLLGSPIVKAEEASSHENPSDAKAETIEYQDSFTWTFYHLSTVKGTVTLRWYGSSNGYYSESVDFWKVA